MRNRRELLDPKQAELIHRALATTQEFNAINAKGAVSVYLESEALEFLIWLSRLDNIFSDDIFHKATNHSTREFWPILIKKFDATKIANAMISIADRNGLVIEQIGDRELRFKIKGVKSA